VGAEQTYSAALGGCGPREKNARYLDAKRESGGKVHSGGPVAKTRGWVFAFVQGPFAGFCCCPGCSFPCRCCCCPCGLAPWPSYHGRRPRLSPSHLSRGHCSACPSAATTPSELASLAYGDLARPAGAGGVQRERAQGAAGHGREPVPERPPAPGGAARTAKSTAQFGPLTRTSPRQERPRPWPRQGWQQASVPRRRGKPPPGGRPGGPTPRTR
jgi:hypothetical protein